MDPASPTLPDPNQSSPLDAALTNFTDGTRRDEARRARQTRTDQAVVDGLSGTFRGTLVDLAEARRPLTILTRSGAHHRGVISTVGADVVVVGDASNPQRLLIAIEAIEGLRAPHLGRGRASNHSSGPHLADLLDSVFDSGQRAALTTRGGNRLMGVVDHVGEDQVTLRLDGDSDTVVVAISSIDEVAVES